ncbi:MAG: hypothetical protein M1495_05830 [Bacteroidetes bacterium]|nr:hypothetical protein [Bacteroidota bacterium]MCL6099223.1 hypothetical protein [Bacteroidota bacterium]
MIVAKVISIISIIVWLFPAIKQYKTDYFYFFLVLAVADPVVLLLGFVLRLTAPFTAPFLMLMQIGSLRPKKLLWLPFALIFLLIFVWFIKESNNALHLTGSIGHLIIFMMIISRLIDQLSSRQLLSGFLVLLSTYELINVLKVLIVITDLMNGITQFYIASFFQILFGIVFCFISIKSSRFDIKLVRD